MVLWKPTRPSTPNTKRQCPFIIGDWNAKVGSQEIPGESDKIGVPNEAGEMLTEFCQENTGHSKHPLPIAQEMTLYMDIIRCLVLKLDWLYSLKPKLEKLYTVSKTRPGNDCSSDHQLLIAKFRIKFKRVGKTTRPFIYDLNQIPCDYTVEITGGFRD